MKKIVLFFSLISSSLFASAQCDVAIAGFDPVSLEMTIIVYDGFCGSSTDSIGEFLLTLTFDPSIPPDENPFPCFTEDGDTDLLFPLNLPFVNIGEGEDEIIQSGDTLTFNLIESQPLGLGTTSCWQEAINAGAFESCIVLFINQINDSETLDGSSAGLGGFAYPDVNLEDNTIIFSLTDACGGLPPPPLVGGCTDSLALNFDPSAEYDDGSCEYVDLSLFYVFIQYDCDTTNFTWNFTPNIELSNWGNTTAESFCVDIFLNNEEDAYATECFDISVTPDADISAQLSTYTPELDGYELPITSIEFVLSNVAGDFNANNDDMYVAEWGIVVPDDCFVYGCTDNNAVNFNPDANVDDGSCLYLVYGCTDPSALNYNPLASVDDDSCLYENEGPSECYEVSIFVPNVFSPNNDGVNDGFQVITKAQCFLEWKTYIFNRWGAVVWEADSPDSIWYGEGYGKTHYVSDGVYVYKIEAIGTSPENTQSVLGHVTIFR